MRRKKIHVARVRCHLQAKTNKTTTQTMDKIEEKRFIIMQLALDSKWGGGNFARKVKHARSTLC